MGTSNAHYHGTYWVRRHLQYKGDDDFPAVEAAAAVKTGRLSGAGASEARHRSVLRRTTSAARRPPPRQWVVFTTKITEAGFPLCLSVSSVVNHQGGYPAIGGSSVNRGRAALVPSVKSGVALRLPPHSRGGDRSE